MFEVFVLAIALSMDALAVSIGVGIKERKSIKMVALKSALFFGFFQALMPLIGYFGSQSIQEYISGYDKAISFAFLLFIGVKMMYESYQDKIEYTIQRISNRVIFTLAMVTSIDAMVAGFTLHLFDLNPFISIVIIGITTFVFSYLGVFVGKTAGSKYEKKAEFIGGVILIFIGLKILQD
ncbi:MAG: manganese efflux pump [Epsilonproteobacteria bacterium]|nr:manganese efflux pump [Campylobacterota bacterium]